MLLSALALSQPNGSHASKYPLPWKSPYMGDHAGHGMPLSD